MFTSEEPTRFKLSCVGSRAMAGALTADVLDVKLDENGTSFREVGLEVYVTFSASSNAVQHTLVLVCHQSEVVLFNCT